MTPDDRKRIDIAELATSMAVDMIRRQLPAIEAFLAWRPTDEDSEGRATKSVLAPLFEAARDYVRTHDAHLKLVNLVLAAVKERA